MKHIKIADTDLKQQLVTQIFMNLPDKATIGDFGCGAGKLLPLGKSVTRIIGGQLGGEIRKFKQVIDDVKSNELLPQGQRTVRPHIRSGHWHGYWYGSGDNKVYDVKWLNATLVNAR